MGKYYNKFLGKNIDLASLGIARQENHDSGFCTPRGESIIGWAGGDGIYSDSDMNEHTPQKEWAVYFNGTIYGYSGKGKAGHEIPVGKEFQFADRTWLVPAVYSCSQGLVVDFCMRVDAKAYQRFFDKWTEKLSGRDADQLSRREQMQAELENPLCLDFNPEITVNGQKLQQKHGSSICYIPSDASNHLEAKQIMNHYHLDCSFAWFLKRISFSWATRRCPEIKTLELTMVQEPSMIPGEVFEVKGSGDRVIVKMPESQFTLTVQNYEPQILDTASLCQDNMDYPTHYTRMRYTLSPEPEAGHLQINDLMECDQPRLKQTTAPEEQSNCCAASIGIIGGADDPTTILVSAPPEKHEFVAYSSPHFEPAERIQWYPVLQVTEYNPVQVELL